MRVLLDIITDLKKPRINEEQVGALLREIEEAGWKVVLTWNDTEEYWEAQLFPGNDLSYFGKGKTLATAAADALDDWFSDYKCE